ncbi:MAG: Gfo/Idh/MocA family oxidoreductase [Armatimonadota bacterium]|nr:Gfo/Idh/MocA family oxidoreductase [Armatimonadota bacterium]
MAVRIGFVGCGGIANAHMRNLAKIEDAEMVAFSDIVEEKAEAAAEEYGGRAFATHEAMYDSVEMDAVYICLPPFAHEDQEIMAAEAGMAIFVEKPIGLSMAKVREIEAAIERAGVINCVGYHWRYHDTARWAQEALEGETIAMVLGWWMGGLPGVAWWRVKEQSGGQIVEQTTHIVDMARYLAGDVERVYAEMALRAMTDVENISVPDVGTVNLRFESGAVGNITNSCVPPGWRNGLCIIGDRKTVVFDQSNFELRTRAGSETKTFQPISAHFRESEAFVQAVETGDQSLILSDYSDGIESLAVSLAANQSADSGEPVMLSDL